jgi:anaphase-promoting complex subunit 1
MAAITSLGLHFPSALPFLVAENILPANPPASLYRWETFADGDYEDEVLWTDTHVAWSRGRLLRRLFSFGIEGEPVHQALLASFPAHDEAASVLRKSGLAEVDKSTSRSNHDITPSDTLASHNQELLQDGDASKALVVFLKYQAHVFFLSGSSHVVTLPFELERAFIAPRGLILQRNLVTPELSQTPAFVPSAPQNSFQSPLLTKSFPPYSSFASFGENSTNQDQNIGLDFDLLQVRTSTRDDSMPRHYSFTSPLSELSHVVQSSGSGFRGSSNSRRSLVTLDKSEEIVYISKTSEMPSVDDFTFILIVTVNLETEVYSIWNASYLDPKPITKALTGKSTPTLGAKSRRRSSYNPTGTVTPVARSRDTLRDSLGPRARQSEVASKKTKKRQSKAAKEKESEELLVSQLDPDFESRDNARETRRISSMQSRADLNTSFDRFAFQDLASQHHGGTLTSTGKRGQSLGAGSDRLSFSASSHRRFRASTPGAFSRLSIEDGSEVGFGVNAMLNESQASATFDEYDMRFDMVNEEPSSYDLHNPMEGLRKELLLRKFKEIDMHSAAQRNSTKTAEKNSKIQVVSILSSRNAEESSSHGQKFFLFIFNQSQREIIQIEVSLDLKRPFQGNTSMDLTELADPKVSRPVPYPTVGLITRLPDIGDAMKLTDSTHSRLLLLRKLRNGQSSVALYSPWSPDTLVRLPLRRLRLVNTNDIAHNNTPMPRNIGIRRSLPAPKEIDRLVHSGSRGQIDIQTSDGKLHRIQLKLFPRSRNVARVMRTALFVLPLGIGEKLLVLWWNRHQALVNSPQREWHALAISILSLVLLCETERKTKRAQRRNVEPSGVREMMNKLDASWNTSMSLSPAWKWSSGMENSESKTSPTSSPHQRLDHALSPGKITKESFSRGYIITARDFLKLPEHRDLFDTIRSYRSTIVPVLPKLLVALHICREDMKLNSTFRDADSPEVTILGPVLAQLGRWIGWTRWDWQAGNFYCLEFIAANSDFEDITIVSEIPEPPTQFLSPPSVMHWMELATGSFGQRIPVIDSIYGNRLSKQVATYAANLTKNITALQQYFDQIKASMNVSQKVEMMKASGLGQNLLENLPESIFAVLKDTIIKCQPSPPTIWSPSLLAYISREDLILRVQPLRQAIQDVPQPKV